MKKIAVVAALTAVLGSVPAVAWWGGGPWGGGPGGWGGPGGSNWGDDMSGDGWGDFSMNMSGGGRGRGWNRYDRYYSPWGVGPYGYGGGPYGYGGGYPGYGGGYPYAAPVAPMPPQPPVEQPGK